MDKNKIKFVTISIFLCVLSIFFGIIMANVMVSQKTIFKIDNIKVEINDKCEISLTKTDATINVNDSFITFNFLNYVYYDAFLDGVNEFGYESENININGYDYDVYHDDEGIYYYITQIPYESFSYIYSNNKFECENLLSKTKFYIDKKE